MIPEWRGFPMNLPPVTDNLMMNLVRPRQILATHFSSLKSTSCNELIFCHGNHSYADFYKLKM